MAFTDGSFTSWTNTATNGSWGGDNIQTGEWYSNGGTIYVDAGTSNFAPITPFQESNLTYSFKGTTYSYVDDNKSIKVDKGSPTKSRYAIFYAVKKDPVIFCRTRKDMYHEVKKLLKRKEVDPRSIRIFALMGGAKVVKKTK